MITIDLTKEKEGVNINFTGNVIYTKDGGGDKNYATKEYVDEEIKKIEIPNTDNFETKADAKSKLNESKRYTDNEIGNIVDSAPVSLNTLNKLATATNTNKESIKSLDSAVRNKVDKSYVDENFQSKGDYATKGDVNNVTQTVVQLGKDVSKKVDKIDGKGLSTEDFTTVLKQKLESLKNFDSSEIENSISQLQTEIDTLVSGNASIAIESFNEIIAFLEGIEDSEDLSSIIASIEQSIAKKADASSLSKVATSGSYNDLKDKPTIPTTTSQLANNSGFITSADVPNELADLSEDTSHRTVTDTEKATWNAKSNFSGDYNDLKNKPNIPSLDGYATELWVSQEIGKIDIPSLDGYATETYVDNKVKDINVPTALSELKDDATHRLVTDTEKNTWNNKSDFDGDYNKLTNKPNIPAAVTESTVSGWGFTKNTGDYSKPSSGIPKSDLASDVQTSLGKANTALQEEQYKGTVTGVKINGTTKNPSNGVVDLGTVITAHQDISGKQDNLVSGTNIKTINGESILGKGNINISGIKWSILKKPVPTVGDIVYMANGSLKFKSPSRWDNSLGTPVGIIMIEEGYAPDGKIRILSLDVLDGYQWGTQSSGFGSGVDSPLPNYLYVVTYDNNGEEYGRTTYSQMPSDVFAGKQSYGDPLAFYYYDDVDTVQGVIPSPYFDGKLHPAYTGVIESSNALSDFNGLSNTQTLVNAGSEYEAANACWNYKDAANSNLQWYLPAMGELCFLMARIGTIVKSLNLIGINSLFQPYASMEYFSSTEYFDSDGGFLFEEGAWILNCHNGTITWNNRGYNEGRLTYPIAMVDSF